MSPDRAPESAWQPPQTWYGELWRVAICAAVSTLAWWEMSQKQWHGHRLLFALDLGLGLIAFGMVFWRRRWPWPVALTLTLMGLLSSVAAGPALLATVSYATRRRMNRIVVLGLVGIGVSWLYSAIEPRVSRDPKWLDVGFSIVITIAMMAIGMYIGSRRELLWSLRVRAEDAERQQGMRVEQARARERERIAREMHDVLAHRISLITMHAGALAYREDLAPDQVRDTANLIATTSHEALGDLREVLGTLRASEGVRPQPTLAALPELIAEASATGMQVELDIAVAAEEQVPDRLTRTVYRMVQEALTNARKHAAGVPVSVALSGAPGSGISVRVRNGRNRFRSVGSRSDGSGLGLVGMRERFELLGGHLDIDDTGAWFVLEGWLPWPR